MNILGVHDLADIRLRLVLGQSTRDDVEMLLDELDSQEDGLSDVAQELDVVATVDAITGEIRDRAEGRAEAEKQIREHEHFERVAGRVVRSFLSSPELADLLRDPRSLALPEEVCSICHHARDREDDGLCCHGKKIIALLVVTLGPTQTGAIVLAGYVVPLFEIIRAAAITGSLRLTDRRRRK